MLPPQATLPKFPLLYAGIWLFCWSLLAFIWIGVFQRASFEHQETITAEMKQNANYAIALEEQTRRTFRNIDQLLRFVVREFARDGAAVRLDRIMADSTIDPALINLTAVMNERGAIIAGPSRTNPGNALDREYFQFHQQQASDTLFIGKPLLGRVSGKWSIPLSRRISKADGSFGGIALITLEPAFFTDLYIKTDIGSKGILTVIGLDGIVRTRKIGNLTTFGHDLSQNPRIRSIIDERESRQAGSYIGPGGIDGVTKIYSFRVMKDYPLIALVGTAMDESLAPVSERQRNYYLVAALVSALIVAFSIALAVAVARQRRFLMAAADSEDRFRSLLELSSDWWWEQDTDLKFVGISLSKSGPELIQQERYAGLARWELPHTQPMNTTWQEHKAVLESRQPFRDLLLIRTGKDGKPRNISVSGKPIFDADGTFKGYRGVGTDITARIESERAMRESEENLRFVLESSRLGYWDHDLLAKKTIRSLRHDQMFGYATLQEKWNYDIFLAHVHPDDRVRVERSVHKLMTDAGDTSAEFRVIWPDQSIHWLWSSGRVGRDAGGQPVRASGVVLDVTERKLSEVALRASEARYRSVVSSMAEGVIVRDQNGLIIDCNASAERILGEPLEQMKGRRNSTVGSRMFGADGLRLSDVERPAATVLRSGQPCSNFIEGFQKPDGNMLWLSTSAQPLYDENAEAISGVVTTFTDITERRRSDELRMAKEAAELSSRTKSTFLSSMSHELRTPLNSILGFAQLLDYDPVVKGSEGTQQRVNHILAAGRHLLAMVDDVLDLSRIEAGALRLSFEPVNMERLIHECVQLCLPEANRRRIRFEYRIGQDDFWVLGDHTRLRQVVVNILSNAIKYNCDGGAVLIGLGGDAARVAIDICDTGPGLSAQQINSLFQPFNRLGAENSATEGTGIGLVIVKQLVLAMRGTVGVSSKLASEATRGTDSGNDNGTARGSTFTLSFPRTAAAGALDNPASPKASPVTVRAQPGKFTVLCVEDNPANVELVKQTLALNPAIQLEIATDGNAGLAAALRLKPDLVLLDINLPGIDGYEVLRRLRSKPASAAIACIAMTANAMSGEAQRARDAGFADYISKPFEVEMLLAKVSALLNRH